MDLEISSPANRRTTAARCPWRVLLAIAAPIGILVLSLALDGCSQSPKEPIALTFLDPEWSHDSRERRSISEDVLQEFTRTTGIRVTHLPSPENSPAQLALALDLLKKSAPTPDVYGIDVIWPGILNKYLVDLKPHFAAEIASQDPELVANYTVKGKLVAVPYHADIGALYYRTDLIQKYGYREPPQTWDELEKMAARIQEGERAKGAKDFWGFVWPGTASEGLTCNALEWQFAEGGGRIIEPGGTISVNNPKAIRAWERAARWVGSISPPSVISYEEWDAANAFWTSGRAAFFRGWTSDYFISHPVNYSVSGQSGLTSVPGGAVARAGMLGGFGLAISRSSAHPLQAVELIRFLLRKEAELEEKRTHSEPPKRPALYELPTILTAYARAANSGGKPGSGVVTRPSTITAQKYEEVSRAYVRTVHSVLTGKLKAPAAADALERELVGITGFETGKP
jgi:trehalose/maltose transport system substrate-binding protein